MVVIVFVIKIDKMKYNRIDIKWRHVSTSFKIYLEMLSYFYDILLQHNFTQGKQISVLVKGLYQTE